MRRATTLTNRIAYHPIVHCECSTQMDNISLGKYQISWNPDCRRCYGTTIEAIPLEEIEPLLLVNPKDYWTQP